MRYSALAFIASATLLLQGCSMIQNLRDDLDDNAPRRKIASDFDFSAPENRNLPPPPVTIDDDRLKKISGTPIDYSGMRAKSGRVTKQEFMAEAQKNENSLWGEDGQHNYLFARNRMKSNGDLVTIKIEDELRKDMVTEVKKLLPPEFRDRDITVPGVTKGVPSDDKGARGVASEAAAAATGDDPTDTMSAEVVERYPNGNMRVRGIKRIPFKTKTRNMEVVAIVKGTDIDDQDNVKSSKFLEHKVELYR